MNSENIVTKQEVLVRGIRSISSRTKVLERAFCLRLLKGVKELLTTGSHRQDPSMGDFCQQNFPTFSSERVNCNKIFLEING